MASFNPLREYGQLLTASAAERSPYVQDLVTKANPLTRVLFDEGRANKRRAASSELRIPVLYDTLQPQWFTGYDKLAITPKELLNSAVFNWSRVVTMFSLSGTEVLYNGGRNELIDLVSTYLGAAERATKQAFEEGLVSDGTADGGRQMIGLNGAVPLIANAGVYGGIDRATVPEWRTTTYNIPNGDVAGFTSWDTTSVRYIIEKIAGARSRGDSYPDLWLCSPESYQAILGSTIAIQRAAADPGRGAWGRSDRAQRLGFTGVSLTTSVGDIDIVQITGLGSVMPANTIFGIDTKSLSLYTFPGQDFVPFHTGDGMRVINQDAFAQGITWSGQLVLDNPLFTVRVVTA